MIVSIASIQLIHLFLRFISIVINVLIDPLSNRSNLIHIMIPFILLIKSLTASAPAL